MRIRTLEVLLTTLYMMTTTFVSSDDMAADSSGSGRETVAQLLENVQAAVADDRALAKMFDIANANQMSEEELTMILQSILTSSLGGSGSASLPGPVEPTEDTPEASNTVSGALKGSLSAILVVLVTVAALSAVL